MYYFIGTAGWTVPKQHLHHFPTNETPLSHLERYSRRMRCVEINSSFHRPHRRSTWEKWAAVTPDEFRFAVKAPKAVTHTAKLVNTGAALLEFFDAVRGLGDKLGPVLLQLPPKLEYDEGIAQEFFSTFRELHTGTAVLEPRHASWFTGAADRLLRSFDLARAAADPPKGSEQATRPGGWPGLRYWRLHGAPRTYYSAYEQDWLIEFERQLRAQDEGSGETWVIFDNTALGHAAGNAVHLHDAVRRTMDERG